MSITSLESVSLGDLTLKEKNYEVRFATTDKDKDAILTLRYKVFNEELGAGLDESNASGRDEDKYDEVCDHLMVIDNESGEIVGTYRMQTKEMADAGNGFYTDDEFYCESIPETYLKEAVEIGRLCITPNHRGRRVLMLLWKGLAMYLNWKQKSLLFGCVSILSNDKEVAGQAWRFFKESIYMHPDMCVDPKPDYHVDVDDASVDDLTFEMPQLVSVYLKYGAKICSKPALDKKFKTIDFLSFFNIESLQAHQFEGFFKFQNK